MPYSITVSFTGLAAAVGHLTKVTDYLDSKAVTDISLAAVNAAGTIFEQNFDAEGKGFGLGGWDDLADSTVRERESKGFGGAHPILIRYGDLRMFTATALRVAGGSGIFGTTDADGKTINVSLNVGQRGAIVIASGEKALNQNPTKYAPARPYWFTTKTVMYAVRRRAVDVLATNIERL
jgi:hypothetical protein